VRSEEHARLLPIRVRSTEPTIGRVGFALLRVLVLQGEVRTEEWRRSTGFQSPCDIELVIWILVEWMEGEEGEGIRVDRLGRL
jgi:hypothetical protein